MKKLVNIRLKDEPNARLVAMKKFKDEFHIGLAESKDEVDKYLNAGEFIIDKTHTCLFENDPSYIAYRLQQIFDCEIEGEEEDEYFPKRKQDEATKEALAWYEEQSDDIKSKIDLIGVWKNPQLIAVG